MLIFWLTPEEGKRAPRGDLAEVEEFASSCAGLRPGALGEIVRRRGAGQVVIRVCRGLFFSRVAPMPEA